MPAAGCRPAPASWHDFFNALIWLAWPRAKAALNSVQHEALNTPGDQRGPISDAATLFDESGLVLVAPDAGIAALLRVKQWRQVFWEARPAWQAARLYVFGHSLLEKSLQPAPGMTGKCLFIEADTRAIPAASVPAWLDERVALDWECRRIMRPSDLFALPIQGVPGFDAANCSRRLLRRRTHLPSSPDQAFNGTDLSQSKAMPGSSKARTSASTNNLFSQISQTIH
jgi:hypothetical protein